MVTAHSVPCTTTALSCDGAATATHSAARARSPDTQAATFHRSRPSMRSLSNAGDRPSAASSAVASAAEEREAESTASPWACWNGGRGPAVASWKPA
uniref:Uncharacterized protein n=1 Tax=Triticum urartu TaxID=4572 RepID=A0A8R7QE97_TRIUA